jgi:two-component system, OmpR family, response regulator
MAKILIVDDEIEVCELIAGGFRQRHHEVDVAYGGAQALDMLLAPDTTYDAMVLDLKMPGVDGIAVLEKRDSFAETKVIILTAYPDMETAMDALNLGANRYLIKDTPALFKPVQIPTVIDMVEKLLYRVKVGPFEADLSNNVAYYRGEVLQLPHKLMDIYVVFLRHPNKMLNYPDIAEALVSDPRTRDKYQDVAELLNQQNPVRISEYFKSQVSRLRNEILDEAMRRDPEDPLAGLEALISRPRAGFYWNPKVKAG